MPGLNYPGISPPTEGVVPLTSPPDGGWSLIQHPMAVYHNGYTYFGWIKATSTGPGYIASYRHSNGVVSTAVQFDGFDGIDDHNNPALLVRDSDHKLMVAFCKHNGPDMFLSISNNSLDSDPTISGGFATAVNLDSSIGASDYTYPVLCQLTGVTNDPLYLFFRDITGPTGRLSYSKSTDGGSTWSARTILMTAAGGDVAYWAIRNTTTRIDIMTTDRAPGGSEGLVDLGHMYLDGTDDKVYKSDATEITATKPFAHSELTQLETNLDGVLAVDGVAGTNPIATYIQDNGDGTVTGRYARWDGSSWDKADVYDDDAHPGDKFFAGMAINQADNEEVFLSRKSGASSSEMWSYTSSDLGLTWDAGTQITTGSGDYNWGCVSVKSGVSTLPVIWLRGTWTSDSSFNQGIRGLAR